MSQKTAYFRASLDVDGDRYAVQPVAIRTRRELVAFVDNCLVHCDFSTRTRRQVNLAFVWRHIQRNGPSVESSFDLESRVPGHAGNIRFHGMTADQFAAHVY